MLGIAPERKALWMNRSGLVLVLLLLLSLILNWNYLRGGFQSDEFFFLNSKRDGS